MSDRRECDLVRVVVPTLGGTHAIVAGLHLFVAADAPPEAEVAAVAAWLARGRTAGNTR